MRRRARPGRRREPLHQRVLTELLREAVGVAREPVEPPPAVERHDRALGAARRRLAARPVGYRRHRLVEAVRLGERQPRAVGEDEALAAGIVAGQRSDAVHAGRVGRCLLYTSPSPRDRTRSRMPSSA